MRLTMLSDLALRALIYLAVNGERLITVREIAAAYGVSEDHMMKVVYRLNSAGWIETVRGRRGGIRLAEQPERIPLGAVVRSTEDSMRIVECFDARTNRCVITPVCGLAGLIDEALQAFLSTLDSYTLADAVERSAGIRALLSPDAPAPVPGRVSETEEPS